MQESSTGHGGCQLAPVKPIPPCRHWPIKRARPPFRYMCTDCCPSAHLQDLRLPPSALSARRLLLVALRLLGEVHAANML